MGFNHRRRGPRAMGSGRRFVSQEIIWWLLEIGNPPKTVYCCKCLTLDDFFGGSPIEKPPYMGLNEKFDGLRHGFFWVDEPLPVTTNHHELDEFQQWLLLSQPRITSHHWSVWSLGQLSTINPVSTTHGSSQGPWLWRAGQLKLTKLHQLSTHHNDLLPQRPGHEGQGRGEASGRWW